MKILLISSAAYLLAISLSAQTTTASVSRSSSNETLVGYQIGQQDGNSRQWQKIVEVADPQGNFSYQTNNAYVELASGLNYKDPTSGQWLPSKEEIDGYAGGAMAQYGQHKVIFANNLNTAGAIDLQTPDGKELKSHVLGLSYYDSASGKSVLMAQLKDCQGQIVGSNQVIYADAFDGINADVCYTYRKGSFEQDVILHQSPPTPESFGLNSTSTTLQVLTEFDSAPTPNAVTLTNRSTLPDELLDFGTMKMIPGKAFAIGQNPLDGARVGKQWTTVNGRNILIESAPVSAIASQLNQLTMVKRTSPQTIAKNSILNIVSTKRLLPTPKLAKANQTKMKLAKMPPVAHGLVLDYVTIVGENDGDFTFQSDTTYYVAGGFNIGGTTYLEGGTVIKYAETSYPYGGIYPLFGFNCQTDPYHPAIITSANDNTVGDTISGSTGSPSRYNCSALDFDVSPTFTGPVEYLQIRYAAVGLTFGDVTPTPVRDCQFLNVGDGVQNYDSGTVTVENCLFSGVSGYALGADNYPWAIMFTAANLTVHHAKNLIGTNTTLSVTNSLFICVTNWGNTFTGAFNATNSSDSGVFASGPFGNEYLATNLYRNAGTTAIDSDLLADLRQTTTYTPADGGYPDADTPDLGFHYPVFGSMGTDFWLAFFDMDDGYDYNLSLYISSQSGATGTVTIPGLGITTNFTVTTGGITEVDLGFFFDFYNPNIMMFDYDAIENYGIHINASAPVSVYALDYAWGNSAAFTGYPTLLLGTNYCILARPSYANLNGFIFGYSELGIVATENDTTVIITPSPSANLVGHPGTTAYTKTLQRGETYQDGSSGYLDDVTSTYITSDKPIAVFAGANEAYVPDENTTGALNPLMQEQLPMDLWGTNALTLSFAGRTGGDLYRVLAYTNTTVTITNSFGVSIVTNLAAGTFCETNLDGWAWFQSTKPIQVAQFENGGETVTSEGDPCEILLSSTGKYLTSYTVVTGPPMDDSQLLPAGFDENYLNVIVGQSGTNSTYVDDIVVTNFVAIGSSGYYGAQVPVTNGSHTVISSQPVGIEVYGFGYLDAYGYFGGIIK
ncbi:MAG TPA: IgGFc-binding protein [Verrucomicrobiae bacterium]|nr:IgGFc-binding protein [Verrucomicrobiae bacterium]